MEFEVKDLGLISYQQAYELQKDYVAQATEGQQFLLLCEHPSVLTLGRLADPAHLLISKQQLEEMNIELISIDRGGEITLHSPGQLVIYPIFNLNNYGKDLHLYMHKLEQVGIDLLSEFDILADRNPGKTGVWVQKKKIASIGIGVRKWISFHGMAINVNTDLDLFKLINPCGLDVQMTSLQQLEGKEIQMPLIKEKAVEKFLNIFVRSMQ